MSRTLIILVSVDYAWCNEDVERKTIYGYKLGQVVCAKQTAVMTDAKQNTGVTKWIVTKAVTITSGHNDELVTSTGDEA